MPEIITGGKTWQDIRKGDVVSIRNDDDPAQLFVVRHHCDPKTWNIANFEGGLEHVLATKDEDEDLDLVVFGVGIGGLGYPSGVPFPARGECLACDRQFERWFKWRPRLGASGIITLR